MENTEQQPMTRAGLEAEIAYRSQAIADKRMGREVMIASGMVLEPEEYDMDMSEHLAALEVATAALSALQAQEDEARIAAAHQAPLL